VTFRDGRTALPAALQRCLGDVHCANDSARALLRRGLAERAANGLSVPREAQRAVRNSLSETDRQLWCDAALGFLKEVWPEEKVYAHAVPACDALVEHMFAATHYAELLQVNPERSGALLNQLGLYLHGCGASARAERCFYRAIVLGQQAARRSARDRGDPLE
jgi:hypothetical protein